MQWSMDADGQARINGVSVEREIYDLFGQLVRFSYASDEQQAARIQALPLNRLLEHPVGGPLVWETLKRYARWLPTELLARAALIAWEDGASRASTILRELADLPEGHRAALLTALADASADEARTPQRREAYRETLETHRQMLEQSQKADQSAEEWVEYWHQLRRQHRLGMMYQPSNTLPDVPAGQENEAVRRLLEARPDERLEGLTQDAQMNWESALTLGLAKALAGPLDEGTTALLLRERVASQQQLDLHSPYGPQLSELLRQVHHAGNLNSIPGVLPAVRRTVMFSPRWSTVTSYEWAADLLTPELNPGEAWADAFLSRLDALPPEQRSAWPALLAFARTATAGKPSAKWLKAARQHLDAVGAENFRGALTASLPLLSRPRTFRLEPFYHGVDPNLLIDEFNAQSLKGLLWMAPLAADADLARAVAATVDSALKKVPGVGPRAPKVANAAAHALSRMESGTALSALARLNTTVTFKGTLKEVHKALDAVATRLNVSREDLLELGVPTLGMEAVGERRETLGEVEARLTVNAGGAALTFSRGGKTLKSVPAAVKKDHAEELKELKAAQKEAEQAVSALALRLDSLMIEPRVWRGEVWRERYLDHPLAGTVARRLIWVVDGTPTFHSEGELRDVNGEAVLLLPEAEVRLWHPLGRGVEEVMAWRGRLESLDIRQPFKQAWREVYVLTDAERRTGTYSNRFAGHILGQHQFHGLAALRGWRNRLRLMVDDSYPPATRDLPAYGLRAEYWIEGIGENYGEDTNESATFLRVTTDQVRFYPLGAPENHAHAGGGGYTMWVSQYQQPAPPLPLEDIPPLVLSEILRDVDLFVGVASVGNDPTWQDGGPGGRFREYWQSYSFGELTETAKTRAEYLGRLIPRLKIGGRLSLDGRFLRVRGDRRTYKIHLGSSNILMEPNDQYLCIIPGGKGEGLELNLDGDRVLGLVLSKAFLLADDTAITDPVILEQLGR